LVVLIALGQKGYSVDVNYPNEFFLK